MHNLGRVIVDGFTKVSKIGFSMERFTAWGSGIKIFLLDVLPSPRIQFQAFRGFS